MSTAAPVSRRFGELCCRRNFSFAFHPLPRRADLKNHSLARSLARLAGMVPRRPPQLAAKPALALLESGGDPWGARALGARGALVRLQGNTITAGLTC